VFYTLFGEAVYYRYATGYEMSTLMEAQQLENRESVEHKSRALTDPYGV